MKGEDQRPMGLLNDILAVCRWINCNLDVLKFLTLHTRLNLDNHNLTHFPNSKDIRFFNKECLTVQLRR